MPTMTTTQTTATETRPTHCTCCGLPLWETCQPGCPERDAYYAEAAQAVAAARPNRRQRQDKPTVRLRRPTCTELLGRPDLIAQLVLATA